VPSVRPPRPLPSRARLLKRRACPRPCSRCKTSI
jgi:hypothetical protein